MITQSSIYNGLQLDRYPGSQFLFNKISSKKILKVCIRETFNQFNENKEFQSVSNEIVKFCDIFLSTSTSKNKLNISKKIPEKKILHIGSPRYSKFWCNKIDNHYANRKYVKSKKNINILYLPNKVSNGKAKCTLLDIDEQNQVVMKLLELNKNIKLFIKTHPKVSMIYYRKFFTKNNNSNNVKFLPSSDDTSLFLQRSDIIITPGTSFIPHCLWAGKPVILLDEWYIKQGYSFTYENLCNGINEFDYLVDKLIKREFLPDKEIFRKLASSFECGVSSESYKKFLQDKLRLILNAADTKNINAIKRQGN